MFRWMKKVVDKLNEPTQADKAFDHLLRETLKAEPERFRRGIFNDPMVSREMLLKQRIWVDAQGNRILFEHMDIQRLINILVYKSTRAYKQHLRSYFGKMIGVASDPEYYTNGIFGAGRHTAGDAQMDPATRAILQELVNRGAELVAKGYPEDYVPDRAWDEEPPIDRDDEVPWEEH